MRFVVDLGLFVELAKAREGLVLVASKKNPNVKRWQRMNQAPQGQAAPTPAPPAPAASGDDYDPDENVNPPSLLTPEEASLPKRTSQPTKDGTELFALAEQGQADSVHLLSQLAAQLGGDIIRGDQGQKAKDLPDKPVVMVGPMKERSRSEEKVKAENEGDWSQLLDIVRATVSVPSYEQVPQVLALVRQHFPPARAPKDRFADPVAGYRDMLYNYRLPNGMVAELQIAVHPMLEAKQGPGHKIYDKIRKITGPIQEAKRKPTAEEMTAIDRLTAESWSTYAEPWGRAYGKRQADLQKGRDVETKYYDYDGLPAIRREADDFPHIVRPDGREDRVYDMARFIQEAQEITHAQFEELLGA
jgi:hypothetical protein